jgi:hypothetical protein
MSVFKKRDLRMAGVRVKKSFALLGYPDKFQAKHDIAMQLLLDLEYL